MKIFSRSLIAISICLLVFFNESAFAAESQIKLVLQVTIDQLRGDLPLRFKKRFGKGGFRYLMDNGAYYRNAFFDHADTETAPGHATLVTGGYPMQHGIANSEWWDYEKKKVVYSVEDSNYPMLGEGLLSTSGTTTTEKGRAPTNLLSTTIGDEISLASEGQSKVIAISGKDRGAIIPGGKLGKAYWLSQGQFTNSTFYNQDLPEWVKNWNNKKLASTYKGKSWDLLEPRQNYKRKDQDNREYEGYFLHLGKTMPKSFEAKNEKEFLQALGRTPVNDELVLDFSKYAIKELKLGQQDETDYLSISFSSTDYVGHNWGVGSLEAEDNLLRVDRNLENLFQFVKENIGLEKTLIVLGADHGVGEIAEQLKELGIDSKRIETKPFKLFLNSGLKKKFSIETDLVESFVYPYAYLNLEEIENKKLTQSQVEAATASLAMSYPGITFAVTRSDILSGKLPANFGYYQKIRNTFHPKRSGHVHVVTDPFVMFGAVKTSEPGEHGSVWSYDSYVPVIFTGAGIKPGQYFRRIGPQDIAPTIAALLGIKPPSGSIGDPLLEVCQ
ncbi:MAG: alkaline phosphatase family protein [Cyanobacteria bacterium TGS_CYA1]|nr:alkaline phosphatase family protein [Cyanobacteria bacterium TGS_CYA1]